MTVGAFVSRLIPSFITESQDALVFAGKVAKEGCIQDKGVIAIVVHYLWLQLYCRIVKIVKDGFSRLQYWNTLAMGS
jgi:hypothetical protein